MEVTSRNKQHGMGELSLPSFSSARLRKRQHLLPPWMHVSTTFVAQFIACLQPSAIVILQNSRNNRFDYSKKKVLCLKCGLTEFPPEMQLLISITMQW